MPGYSLTSMTRLDQVGSLKRDDKCIKCIIFHMAVECVENGEIRN